MDHASLKQERRHVSRASSMSTVIQTQLETTSPGDAWEQEAERAADLVAGAPRKSVEVSLGEAPAISAYGGTSVPISSRMESQFQALQGGGMAMPDGLLSQMQNGFGRDFSAVRLHTDSESAQMNASLGSRAFTHGNDIYFNEGQYQPETAEGRHLIAHELAHTLQQSGRVGRETTPATTSTPVTYSAPVSTPAQEEQEADEEADLATARGYISDACGFIGALSEILVDTSHFRTAIRERRAFAELLKYPSKALIDLVQDTDGVFKMPAKGNRLTEMRKSVSEAFSRYDKFYTKTDAVSTPLMSSANKSTALAVRPAPGTTALATRPSALAVPVANAANGASKVANRARKILRGGFDVFSWAVQVYDWASKAWHAGQAARNSGWEGSMMLDLGYSVLRLSTSAADLPLVSPYPPHVTAVLKAWNSGCAIGDIINDILKWTGLDELRLAEANYMAERWGGAGTTAGNVAAFATSVPVLGEVLAGGTRLKEMEMDYVSESLGGVDTTAGFVGGIIAGIPLVGDLFTIGVLGARSIDEAIHDDD